MSENEIPASPDGSPHSGKMLDSWGEIANYFNREIRTVQRWEKFEGLPVHRHGHSKKSTVYAYACELDAWFKKRQPKDDPAADARFVPDPENDDLSPDAIAAKTESAGSASGSNGGKSAQPKPGDSTASPNGTENPSLWTGKRIVLLVSLALIVGYVAHVAYNRIFNSEAATQGTVRLVVLPFANLSGDAKENYLSKGMTDVITTQLGRLDPRHLRVIAPTSARILAGKPIAQIRDALNVQYVLEGSVQSVANQIRIDVRLIQTSDEAQAGSDSFTRDLSDFLNVESEVSEAVARRMLATLPPVPGTSASAGVHPGGPVSAESIRKSDDAFLRGEVIWTNRSDLKGSISLFEEAIRENPENAQAWAGLAAATALQGQVPNDGLSPREAKPKAREAAQKALQLDPRLAEAHTVLGNVAMSYDWDFVVAEKEFKTAIELNSNYATAHEWYAHLLMVQGRYEEALAESQHVLEIEPATPLFHAVRAEILYYSRRYDEALQETSGVLRDHPDFVLAYYWQGCAYREKKMFPESVATFERARQLTDDSPFMVMAYGHAQALAGNRPEAQKALATLSQMRHTRPIPEIYSAAILVGLGEKENAFAALGRAYDNRVDRLLYLKVEPMSDPLRSDPRFAQLLSRIGLR